MAELGLAPAMPALADLIDLRTESVAESHAEARRLAPQLAPARSTR